MAKEKNEYLQVDEDKRLWDKGYTAEGMWRPTELRVRDLARRKEVMAALAAIEDFDEVTKNRGELKKECIEKYLRKLHIPFRSDAKKETLTELLRPKWKEARAKAEENSNTEQTL